MIDVFATATKHLAHLAKGDYSAAELLEAHLAQVDAHNGRINALVWQDRDRARKLAAKSHAKPSPDQPLAGLPMTIKESFNVTGASSRIVSGSCRRG